MDLEILFSEYKECFDRFTFDNIFRILPTEGYTHEEIKDLILFNCQLSAIIFQERIDNGFYKTIRVDEEISEDLLQMKQEMLYSALLKNKWIIVIAFY